MTEPHDNLGRRRPVREHEIVARKQTMLAARALMNAEGRFNRDEIAREHSVTPSGVSQAVIILKHGTPEEIEAIEIGMAGLRPVYDRVRARVEVGDRIRSRTKPAFTDNRREQIKNDSAVYNNLRMALDMIGSMPRPDDVVKVIKRNGVRTLVLDKKIIDAFSWLAEFSDAWTK